MPVNKPALVRQVASDVLPKPPARPSLATNRTDTFPLSVQHRHQSFDSQATQVPPSPPPQPVGAGDRSTPHFTNPFDNNKPLEPLARLPRSDYKPVPKKFLRPGGYKPPKTTAEKISGICPSWIYHPKPALPEFDEKRIRPVKDDISPFDTSMMEDKRLLKRVHGESNLCNKYRQAVEQSPTPSHARQHQVKEAKR
ncbi:hypothetical protein MPER_02992 [Moniliophthora perniciosa FA553]|nr:hypothetical protein MPER_02992 [Moniliophthora perniciosa FA553]